MVEPTWFRYYAMLPVWMQNGLCSLAGFRMRRERYNRVFWNTLHSLQRSQRWTLAEQKEYQNERLGELVRLAYERTPYWRELFDQRGLKPGDIRTAEDLPKLPILSKDTVWQRGEDMVVRGWPEVRLLDEHTGGTTGASLRMKVDEDAIAQHWAYYWRHRLRFGVKVLDPFIVFAGRPVVPMSAMRPPFWRRNLPMHQTYVSVHHMTRENMAALAEYLKTRRVVIYNGYPSALYLMACYLLDHDIRLPNPPKMTFTGSETLLPHQREAMRRAFDSDVGDHYGASELSTFISECAHHRYHVDMEYGIAEFVPMPGGPARVGRIIGTGLLNMAMPMLRYDIGDLATVAPRETTCPCGLVAPIVERIDGRLESYVITPDGRQLSRLTFLFKGTDNIREAQLVQDSLDHLTARVVRRDSYTDDDERIFMADMRTLLGEQIRIDIEYVEDIPREPNGKFRHIISEVFQDRYRDLAPPPPAALSA